VTRIRDYVNKLAHLSVVRVDVELGATKVECIERAAVAVAGAADAERGRTESEFQRSISVWIIFSPRRKAGGRGEREVCSGYGCRRGVEAGLRSLA
jgi:hypothetical protein